MKLKKGLFTTLALTLFLTPTMKVNADELAIPRANSIKKETVLVEDKNKIKEDIKEKSSNNIKYSLKEEEDYDNLFKDYFFNSNYKYEDNKTLKIKDIDSIFKLRDYTKPFDVKYSNIKKTFKVNSPWVEFSNISSDIKSVTNNGKVKVINNDTIQIDYDNNVHLIFKGLNIKTSNGSTLNKGDIIGVANGDVCVEMNFKGNQISPLFLFVDNLFPRGGMNVPLMRQTDPIWKNYRYGDTTNLIAGCGPTSLAMVISYLNNEYITPAKMITEVGGVNSKYMISGQGSLWSMMTEVPEKYGLKSKSIKGQKELEDALNSNSPVIAIMRNGYFTDGGHYIVIRGIDKDGYLLVNDPADMNSKDNYKKSFLASKVISEAKNMWAISK